MGYKYFKVIDTTKSVLRTQEGSTEDTIEYNKELIGFYKDQIDRLTADIEFYKVLNYYAAHRLKKNNVIIEME